MITKETTSKPEQASKKKDVQKKSQPSPQTARVNTVGENPQYLNSNDVLSLQRQIGNQAVSRMIADSVVQTKLTVGAAGDAYEQEADRVAEQVMNAPAGPVQRISPGEEEEPVQAKPLASGLTPLIRREPEEEEPLQGKSENPLAGSFDVGSQFEDRLHNSGGQPLSNDVRAFMEPRFGADFSNVQIHRDAESAQLANDIGAQAFTRGADIYLGQGKYDPDQSAGKQLLAHELTHVIQQGGAQAASGPAAIQQKAEEDQPLQRALSYDDTNWDEATSIKFLKGAPTEQDMVLMYKDTGGGGLIVKTEEDAEAASAAAKMIGAAAETRTRGGGDWQISTPKLRKATAEDRAGMTAKIVTPMLQSHIKIDPDSKRDARKAMAATLRAFPNLTVQSFASGKTAEMDKNPETATPFLNDPAYRKALGYATVMDVILGNFDRMLYMNSIGYQNWMLDASQSTIHLIDNIDRARPADDNAWRSHRWVKWVKDRDWAAIKANRLDILATDPDFQRVGNAAAQRAWMDGFLAGMAQAMADLPRIYQNLLDKRNVAAPDVALDILMDRMHYLMSGSARLARTRIRNAGGGH